MLFSQLSGSATRFFRNLPRHGVIQERGSEVGTDISAGTIATFREDEEFCVELPMEIERERHRRNPGGAPGIFCIELEA